VSGSDEFDDGDRVSWNSGSTATGEAVHEPDALRKASN